jgi:hypothetical protein
VRLGVTSGHVGARRLPVSVDKRRQQWLGLSERSPLTTARTMEQKVTKETKETKNTRVVTLLQIQYAAPDSDSRRLKLGRFLPFVAFATLCSRSVYERQELENLRVTRIPFPCPSVPSVDKPLRRWLGPGNDRRKKTNTSEQKVTMETKNTRVVTRSKIQYAAPDSDSRRLKLA